MLVVHLESARRDARAAEREQGGQRRPPLQGFSQRRLLFTIAITGIAVLLGSLFFQKKTENHWNALGVGRNNLRICNSALKLCIHLSGSKSFWENATITVELIRMSLIYIYTLTKKDCILFGIFCSLVDWFTSFAWNMYRSRRFFSQDRAAFLPNAVYLKLFAACFKMQKIVADLWSRQASLSPYQNPSSIYLCL